MSKNPLTACDKYNQCYFSHSIKALINQFKEYAENLRRVDTRLWPDYQRGAHNARKTLTANVIFDLQGILAALDGDLVDTPESYVVI